MGEELVLLFLLLGEEPVKEGFGFGGAVLVLHSSNKIVNKTYEFTL